MPLLDIKGYDNSDYLKKLKLALFKICKDPEVESYLASQQLSSMDFVNQVEYGLLHDSDEDSVKFLKRYCEKILIQDDDWNEEEEFALFRAFHAAKKSFKTREELIKIALKRKNDDLVRGLVGGYKSTFKSKGVFMSLIGSEEGVYQFMTFDEFNDDEVGTHYYLRTSWMKEEGMPIVYSGHFFDRFKKRMSLPKEMERDEVVLYFLETMTKHDWTPLFICRDRSKRNLMIYTAGGAGLGRKVNKMNYVKTYISESLLKKHQLPEIIERMLFFNDRKSMLEGVELSAS